METNTRLLVAKHPDYPERVRRFIAADPLLPVRKLAETNLRILAEGNTQGILHILHSRQGGTEAHIRDLMRAEKVHFRHYLLIVHQDSWFLEDGNGERWLTYELQRGNDEQWSTLLNALCATLNISLCHVHHLSGAREGLLLALSDLSIPYGITLHDSYLACPTVTLLAQDGDYCGAITNPEKCQRCLDAQVLYRGIKIDEWRKEHQALLARAAFVLAPSVAVADTLRRYYPFLEPRIIPHGTAANSLSYSETDEICSALLMPHDKKIVLGVLGAIGPVKGARRLERLVAKTKARNLPLRWVVIGYTDHQYQPWQDKDKTLTIHGAYKSRDLAALIDHYRVRLMVFPSAGPESFSYTLSESWILGCPALVPSIGALHERVVASGAGWVMHDWKDEDAILDQIMTICADENQEDFVHRASLAAATPLPSLTDMAEATASVYASCFMSAGISQSADAPLPKERLLVAGREKAQTTIESKGVSHAILRQILHLALRLRYTRLGYWLYRTIPAHWQQRAKAYLTG